jgi:hypothetical protein
VVFIPKTRRNSSTGPRGFRPTNLTSLLLKSMERLVDGAVVLEHCIPISKFTRMGNLWKGVFSSWFVLRRHVTCRIQLWMFSWTLKELLTTRLLISKVLLWVGTGSAPLFSNGLELPQMAAWPQQLPVSHLGGSSVQGLPTGRRAITHHSCGTSLSTIFEAQRSSVSTQGYADCTCLLAVDKFLNTVRTHTEDHLHCWSMVCLGWLVS